MAGLTNTTTYDAITGEIIQASDTQLAPLDTDADALALRTDAELVALSEYVLTDTLAQLDKLEPQNASATRTKVQALNKQITRAIRSREAKLEATNNIIEARLRIERKTGALIPVWQNGGALLKPSQKAVALSDRLAQRLTDVSVTKDQSSTWQKVARIDEGIFEDYIATSKENGWEMSTAALLWFARKTADKPETPPLPEGTFSVIYADPPWSYSNSGFDQSAASHYPTMPTTDICAIPVKAKAAENAVMFMWATAPLLPDAIRVLTEWGFEYKTCMVWKKNRAPGSGWWVRTYHELLLIGSHGSFTPAFLPDSVFDAPVTEHSRKPDEVYDIIEKMYPDAKYLELFARRPRDGWAAFGNEV